ncbi:MAG: alkaline phosphatase family protein [Patescibacteria group bacterium]
MSQKKLFVLGLDCATPQFLFDEYLDDLPTFKKLFSQGAYGKLRSTIPAITVPAWMSMMTSQTPGDLGIYGFRGRRAGSGYNDMFIASAEHVQYKKVWDYLNMAGLKTGMLSVPLTYPPQTVDGFMVSGFMTPSLESEFTYPKELKQEIADVVGEYIFDFANRSTEAPEKILEKIYEMTDKRHKLIKYFIKNKQWDFLMMVEMGVDRIHHYMWSYVDPKHPKFQGENNKFKNSIKEYYQHIDRQLSEILDLLPKECSVMIVSDHGAKAMDGMFLINEWLIKEGYLVLKNYPTSVTRLEKCDIDWSKTKAWAWGGFYSRIFINVKRRDPEGIVEDFETERDSLARKLKAITDDHGNKLINIVAPANELYNDPQGDVPDLLGFFGDLSWRPGGTVGHNKIYIHENDTGPDDGVHDWNGIYAFWQPEKTGSGLLPESSILDIAPTILNYFGVDIPKDFKGKIINY